MELIMLTNLQYLHFEDNKNITGNLTFVCQIEPFNITTYDYPVLGADCSGSNPGVTCGCCCCSLTACGDA